VFSESKARTDRYVLCNNLATLLWLAHMGALEVHAWHSRVAGGDDSANAGAEFGVSLAKLRASVLERPDYVLFDLDPFLGPTAHAREPAWDPQSFARVGEIAFALHALLGGIGLASLVKTSGRSGLHVIVPIARALPYEAARGMAGAIAARLRRERPREITLEWAIERRDGKVFVDTNMNARGKSIAAPYSARALPGAPVSTPLAWDALRDADPRDFRIPTVPARLERHGDAWQGWLARKQDVRGRLAASAA
jgi:bifunctional non-homologous end joining protein LigD